MLCSHGWTGEEIVSLLEEGIVRTKWYR